MDAKPEPVAREKAQDPVEYALLRAPVALAANPAGTRATVLGNVSSALD